MSDQTFKVDTFLSAMSYKYDHSKDKFQIYPFITISREVGAGGRTLANTILQKMEQELDKDLFHGWQVFDQELCKLVLQDSKLKVSLHSLLTEEYHSKVEDMVAELALGYSGQDVVMFKIFKIIRTLASVGKVIIVGRGGACVTQKMPLGLHFRLVAPLKVRIQRMEQILNTHQDEALEIIQEQDKARRRLVKSFFNREIDDPLLYHAIFNSNSMSISNIANTIVELIKMKKEINK